MPNLSSLRSKLTLIALMANYSLYYVGASFFLPLLPDAARFYQVRPVYVQLSVTAVLFGLASAQLFVGYLSDVIGRKKILLLTTPLFVIGAFFCYAAQHVMFFLLGIYLIGVAGGTSAVITQAMAHDLYNKKTVGLVSFIVFIANLITMLSLLLSGYMAHYKHWQLTFLVIALFGIVVLLLSFTLPTENKPSSTKDAFSLKNMFSSYLELFKNRHFLVVAMPYALSTAGTFVFKAISPFLLIESLQVSAKAYGYMMNLLTLGLMVGSFFIVLTSEHLKRKTIILVGALCCFSGGILMLLLTDLYFISPFEVIAAMFIYMIGAGILSPALKTAAMAIFNVFAGTAVALVSVSTNIISGTGAYIASHYLDKYLGMCLFAIGALIFCAYFLMLKDKDAINIIE